MKTKGKLLRFLSIFLACVMFVNAPMSVMAFDDVQWLIEQGYIKGVDL